jgi:hypothetical protein
MLFFFFVFFLTDILRISGETTPKHPNEPKDACSTDIPIRIITRVTSQVGQSVSFTHLSDNGIGSLPPFHRLVG